MRYGKILLPLCMAGSQAMAGQVSGGGPSAVIKAEEYTLSEPDFQALRDSLRRLEPQRAELSGNAGNDEPFVIRDESGQLIIVRKSADDAAPERFEFGRE